MGPALSCFDVDLSAAFQPGSASKSSSEAKRTAQQQATAQEARNMLGTVTPCVGPHRLRTLCLLQASRACIKVYHGDLYSLG